MCDSNPDAQGNPKFYCRACLGFMKKTAGENENLILEKCGKCCNNAKLDHAAMEEIYYDLDPKATCTDDEDGLWDCVTKMVYGSAYK